MKIIRAKGPSFLIVLAFCSSKVYNEKHVRGNDTLAARGDVT